MRMRTPTIALALLLAAQLAGAVDSYISGIPIPLRAEPDPSNRKILQLLTAGEKVSLSNKNKNEFTLITTSSGTRGWIPSRYLTKTPPLTVAAEKQSNGKRQVKVELENSRLKSTVASIKQEKQILEDEIQMLNESARKANQEVKAIRGASGNALELENQNYVLKDQVRIQKRNLEALQQENEALQDRKDRDWFLVGALVAFLALLTGFFLSRMRGRNSNIRRRSL